MRAILLITVPGPNQREAEQFSRDLERLRVDAELIEADSREGVALKELYDIVSSPAVIVAQNDGTLVEQWQGSWPLATDVSYHYHT